MKCSPYGSRRRFSSLTLLRGLSAVGLLALNSCAGVQSALDPSGPIAGEIAALWWGMFWAAVAIFTLVLGLLLYAVLPHPVSRRQVQPMRMVVLGGIALPVAALSVLLPFGFYVGNGATAPLPNEAVTIRVTGRQWWWDIEYVDEEGRRGFTTANEIYIPVGKPVEIFLTSADVIHSLWLPRLAGKLDLIPGHTNRLVLEADRPGIFRGQCAEYCGIAHAKMALYAVALPPDEFASWAERQVERAVNKKEGMVVEGQALFSANGCPLCHTVRGHQAFGQQGPDLTHVGSRKTIGAGLLDNTRDNIALWIARNDDLKPGNRMPDYGHLDRKTRLAIAAYLESLR